MLVNYFTFDTQVILCLTYQHCFILPFHNRLGGLKVIYWFKWNPTLAAGSAFYSGEIGYWIQREEFAND